jgi:hypothetical protein
MPRNSLKRRQRSFSEKRGEVFTHSYAIVDGEKLAEKLFRTVLLKKIHGLRQPMGAEI